ncbi:hypothetical protein [Thermodesulfovibrio sp.]|uniref:hypothetical protein n=1 Tax=Thermodesulfovibrio sp. TaxID=2067987 RepID=UPI0030AF57C6
MKRFVLFLIMATVVFVISGWAGKIETYSSSNFSQKGSIDNLFADTANCAPWNLQPNGCYERVCCCDKNGQHWCERCCPDKNGKCTPERVKC